MRACLQLHLGDGAVLGHVSLIFGYLSTVSFIFSASPFGGRAITDPQQKKNGLGECAGMARPRRSLDGTNSRPVAIDPVQPNRSRSFADLARVALETEEAHNDMARSGSFPAITNTGVPNNRVGKPVVCTERSVSRTSLSCCDQRGC